MFVLGPPSPIVDGSIFLPVSHLCHPNMLYYTRGAGFRVMAKIATCLCAWWGRVDFSVLAPYHQRPELAIYRRPALFPWTVWSAGRCLDSSVPVSSLLSRWIKSGGKQKIRTPTSQELEPECVAFGGYCQSVGGRRRKQTNTHAPVPLRYGPRVPPPPPAPSLPFLVQFV